MPMVAWREGDTLVIELDLPGVEPGSVDLDGVSWPVGPAVPIGTCSRLFFDARAGRMARRQFQVIDVVEVLQHWHAGRPKTVRKYVAATAAAGIVTGGGQGADRAGWAARVAGWFPELVDAKAGSRTWPALEARRDLITVMLATNTVATVHQRLRDEHGLTVSESSLRR